MGQIKQTSLNINEDILVFCKENNIKLSHWVTEKFMNEFFGINSKIKRLEEIKAEEEKLKKEIEFIKLRSEDIKTNLTTREIQYFQSVDLKLKKGFDMKAMHNFFIDEYRNIDFDEFVAICLKYREINDERTKYRIKKR